MTIPRDSCFTAAMRARSAAACSAFFSACSRLLFSTATSCLSESIVCVCAFFSFVSFWLAAMIVAASASACCAFRPAA